MCMIFGSSQGDKDARMGWRDCSAVKSTCGSSRRPRFDSQYIRGDSQSSVRRLPWDQKPFSRHTCDALTYRQNTHKQRIIIFKKKSWGIPFCVFCWRNCWETTTTWSYLEEEAAFRSVDRLGLEHLYPNATHAAMCGLSDTDRVSLIRWALVSWWNDKTPAVTRWGRPGACEGSFSVRWSPRVSCQGADLPSHDLSNTIAVAGVFWDHWLT